MALMDSMASVAKFLTQISNPEMITAVAQANAEAVALSKESLGLQRRVMELEEEVRLLQAQRDLKAKLFRLGGYIFIEGDPDARCPICWEMVRKLVPMRELDGCGRCPVNQDHYVNRNKPLQP
jgi:hypothetical protein